MAKARPKKRNNDRRWHQRRKCWLVSNWRTAHKWLSVQLSALIATAAGLYEIVPAMKEYLPDNVFHYLITAAITGVILARIYQQKPKG